MKHAPDREAKPRFSGSLRHYHRVGSQAPRTWDEWVDGKKSRGFSTAWLKGLGIVVALLALCGIVAGLIIELR